MLHSSSLIRRIGQCDSFKYFSPNNFKLSANLAHLKKVMLLVNINNRLISVKTHVHENLLYTLYISYSVFRGI